MKARPRARIQVLVVRHGRPLFADVLAKALGSEPTVRIMSRPLTVEEALDFCARHHPDVLLVEATEASVPSLPPLVRSIAAGCDGSPVVLLADALIDDAFLVAGIEAGAFGIVDGESGIGEVVRSVRAAADGRRLVDPDRFLTAVEKAARRRDDERELAERVGQLTARERQVLGRLTEGDRNVEIAKRLSISPRTVDKHVEHILAKLQARSRLHAAALAARARDLTYDPIGPTT